VSHRRLWSVASLAFLTVGALVVVACGGGGSIAAKVTTTAATSSPVASTSASPKESPGSSPTNTPAPTTPSATDIAEAAKAAAIRELDAIYVSPIGRDPCEQNNPGQKMCIELNSTAEDAVHGIVRFLSGFPGGGGAAIYFGRMADGGWHYWFGTQQNVYEVTRFPADAFVCARGAGLNVREQPSTAATVVTLLKDLVVMRAEEFVLTQPGTYGHAGPDPDGWYRISSPVQGWVNYRYVSDASLKTCEFHDAVQRTP
jgi:hypothetical protein